MESQPQNPEFRNNPENFHPCVCNIKSNYRLEVFRLLPSMVDVC